MEARRAAGCYLAVPAHRESMVRKAAASEADAVFLDLEDAVPADEKPAALAGALAALADLDWGRKHVSVRVNAADSPSLADELDALATRTRLDGVILPKAERIDAVVAAAGRLAAGRPEGAAPVALELLIETALGLLSVDTLAGCHPTIGVLHLGVGDLAASLGARTADVGLSPPDYRHLGPAPAGEYSETVLDLFAYPMMKVLVAARAYGLQAIDGPWGGFQDDLMTAAGARKAAAMGFDGKQAIHPRQIRPTQDAFAPTAAELDYARRVVAALETAKAEGKGAVVVDGKMVDEANLRLIRRTLDFAR